MLFRSDTAHAPILHRRISENTDRPGISISTDLIKAETARVDVDRTDYGYRYAGIRSLGDRGELIRSYHWVMPFHQFRPLQFGYYGQDPRELIAGHIWVPMDDENCMVYNWVYNYGGTPLTQADRDEEIRLGRGPGEVLPDFRTKRNKSNDWMIDRSVQKTDTFTGIKGIRQQDMALTESMGTIYDRTKEHLGTTDQTIIKTRRRFIAAARQLAEDGTPPPGVDTPTAYHQRSGQIALSQDVDWWDATKELRETFNVEPMAMEAVG